MKFVHFLTGLHAITESCKLFLYCGYKCVVILFPSFWLTHVVSWWPCFSRAELILLTPNLPTICIYYHMYWIWFFKVGSHVPQTSLTHYGWPWFHDLLDSTFWILDERPLVYDASCGLDKQSTSWAPFGNPDWCFLMPKKIHLLYTWRCPFWFLSPSQD